MPGSCGGLALESLKVGASINVGVHWWDLCDHSELVEVEEYAHGRETQRWKYNERQFRAVRKQLRPRFGSHAGFSDLFVPLVCNGEVVATIVVGPFSARPQRCGHPRSLAMAHGGAGTSHRSRVSRVPQDSARHFAPRPEGRGQNIERLMTCLAQLMAGNGSGDFLLNEVHCMEADLAGAGVQADHMWG